MAASLSNADRRGMETVDPPTSDAARAVNGDVAPLVPRDGDWWREPPFGNSASGGSAHGPWVRALYDDWVARLGANRMRGFLKRLADQLQLLIVEIERHGYDATVDRLAHDVASTAGMMGFTEVTRRCRALRGGRPGAEDLAALASALAAAHACIAADLGIEAESAAA